MAIRSCEPRPMLGVPDARVGRALPAAANPSGSRYSATTAQVGDAAGQHPRQARGGSHPRRPGPAARIGELPSRIHDRVPLRPRPRGRPRPAGEGLGPGWPPAFLPGLARRRSPASSAARCEPRAVAGSWVSLPASWTAAVQPVEDRPRRLARCRARTSGTAVAGNAPAGALVCRAWSWSPACRAGTLSSRAVVVMPRPPNSTSSDSRVIAGRGRRRQSALCWPVGHGGPAPPDHLLLAGREVKLCGGQMRVTEDPLHIGQRQCGSSGHAEGGGVPQGVQRPEAPSWSFARSNMR